MPLSDPRLRALEEGFSASPLTRISDPLLRRCNVELWIKRDDLLHPVISGNKWRKLKYILDHALSLPIDTLAGMGGAYSNHLHALAYAGRCLGLKTAGMVRGEQPAAPNPTLRDLQAWGMALRFVPRTEYRELRRVKRWDGFPGIGASAYWLPEGGAAPLALRGVGEIVEEIDIDYDYLCAPCGTGTTLAGLIAAAPQATVLGFAAMKGGGFLQREVAALLLSRPENTSAQGKAKASELAFRHAAGGRYLLAGLKPIATQPLCRWSINTDYHFGGFAKTAPALHGFIDAFAGVAGIALEPVYTAKMLYGVYDLARHGYFPAGARIVALHTGGLQGNRGFEHG